MSTNTSLHSYNMFCHQYLDKCYFMNNRAPIQITLTNEVAQWISEQWSEYDRHIC